MQKDGANVNLAEEVFKTQKKKLLLSILTGIIFVNVRKILIMQLILLDN
jgi:hypothetical protein